ncbi:MAG: hypothetical protein E7675_04010 [Ruminococcaceae bacterium]|nr:hypothetical protein [Oscillospiraceae bacterium]
MKKLFASLRERSRVTRYLIMSGINIIFFALLSLPMIWAVEGVMPELLQIIVLLGLFCFSLFYGFLSAEIADSIFFANILFALFGGIYGAFIGKGVVSLGDWSALTSYFYCVWFFLRYSLAAFFVGLIVKNTRSY